MEQALGMREFCSVFDNKHHWLAFCYHHSLPSACLTPIKTHSAHIAWIPRDHERLKPDRVIWPG
jgi:hypothetical protein